MIAKLAPAYRMVFSLLLCVILCDGCKKDSPHGSSPAAQRSGPGTNNLKISAADSANIMSAQSAAKKYTGMSIEQLKTAVGAPQQQITSGTETFMTYTSTPETTTQTTFAIRNDRVYAINIGDVHIVLRGAPRK